MRFNWPMLRTFPAVISIVFLFLMTFGTLTYAFYSSFTPVATVAGKLRPNHDYLSWRYLKQATILGIAGAHSPFEGGFNPDQEVEFNATFLSSSNYTPDDITINIGEMSWIQALKPTSQSIVTQNNVAIDYTLISEQKADKRWLNTLTIHLTNTSDKSFAKLPMTVHLADKATWLNSDLPISLLERAGQVANWENITPGLFNYTFRNYLSLSDSTYTPKSTHSLIFSWLFNSLFIVIFKVMISLIISVSSGYVLSKYRFAGKKWIFIALIVSLAIPPQALFISNYMLFNSFSLLNSPWSVILLVLTSAQIIIMKHFFDSMPNNLFAAAAVDGASHWQILSKIYLPLAKPAILTVTIISMQSAWNDFFWPFVFLTAPEENFTLPLGLLSLRNSVGMAINWSSLLAVSFLSVMPTIILFLICRHHIRRTTYRQWRLGHLAKRF